jgi:hypothetical protein
LTSDQVSPLLTPELEADAHTLIAASASIARRAVRALELGTGKWETLTVPTRDGGTTLGAQCEVWQNFPATVPWPAGFSGYIDWVARNATDGTIWLIDFKCRKQLQDGDALQFDYQLPAYQHCLRRMLGVEITGTAHYQIKAAVPRPPPLLKNGQSVSRARNQSCDWETYKATVEEYRFDIGQYLQMKENLPTYQRFTPIYRGAIELDNVWQELCEAARYVATTELSAQRVAPPRPPPRRLHLMQCRGCTMADLCLGELRGHDTDEIRRTSYLMKGQPIPQPTFEPPTIEV